MRLSFTTNENKKLNIIVQPTSDKECDAVIAQKLKEYGIENYLIPIICNSKSKEIN